MILVALLTMASLTSNSENDELCFQPESSVSLSDIHPENSIGYAGTVFSHFAYYFFGLIAFFIPFWCGLRGWGLLFKWDNIKCLRRLYYASWLFFSISILVALSSVDSSTENINYVETKVGLLSYLVAGLLVKLFGTIGTTMICVVALLIFISLLIDWRPPKWEQKVKDVLKWVKEKIGSRYGLTRRKGEEVDSKSTTEKTTGRLKSLWRKISRFNFDFLEPDDDNKHRINTESAKSSDSASVSSLSGNFVTDYEKIKDEVLEREKGKAGNGEQNGRKKIVLRSPAKNPKPGEYQFPGLDILNDNPYPVQSVSSSELQQTANELLNTLKTFGVEVEGNKIKKHPGPIITRYEFKPGVGVKVNQIVNLNSDLALALKAKSIRIIAPIPGKAAVGIEIPNRIPQIVYLKDILQSDAFNDASLKLPLALGKTASGEPYVADLATMPHLLVAGATGSGKSVCLNVMITSLIYRHDPKTLRFLLIDPKMLELSVYQGLPHLERPVVTTPKRAEKLLNDAVAEMEERHEKLASKNVRNIEDYNSKVEDKEKLPYIIIMVDELADLMMSNASTRMEILIKRLAQMARAVGLHLVLATQRPSVDVITGLIKANFPARIAFQVATKVDSRTILDGNGAEQLLGKGDMLFLPPARHEAIRIHGALITSEETNVIMEHIKEQQIEVAKIDNFTKEKTAKRQAELGNDPLLREAAELVVQHKQGSASLLQRRLGIGYPRAARLIDELEEKRIVGACDGSKARDVLVDETYLRRILKNE